MRVKVKISGMVQELDLTRVHYTRSLEVGDKVLIIHPETNELCISVVSFDMHGHLWVTDTARELAPYRWMIRKSDVWDKVFKINKE